MLTYFFDGLSNGKLLTFKTGPPCIVTQILTGLKIQRLKCGLLPYHFIRIIRKYIFVVGKSFQTNGKPNSNTSPINPHLKRGITRLKTSSRVHPEPVHKFGKDSEPVSHLYGRLFGGVAAPPRSSFVRRGGAVQTPVFG